MSEKIVVDLLTVPIADTGKQCAEFSESWEELFTADIPKAFEI